MYPKKKPVGEGDGPHLGQLVSCAFGEQYPNLWAFLCELEFDDGSAREPGTILLCVNEGRAKAWLNDRSEEMSAWVSASTLEGVLQAADAALRDGEADWRATPKRRR